MAGVDLEFVGLRCSAPLCADEFGLVERESLAACWLPAKSRLCESALAGLLGEVEVDVVKRLPIAALADARMVSAIHYSSRSQDELSGRTDAPFAADTYATLVANKRETYMVNKSVDCCAGAPSSDGECRSRGRGVGDDLYLSSRKVGRYDR